MQQVYDPSGLLRSILRIGKRAVVSFPNFCHWKIRMQLAATGHVPVTKELPYEWSNTPNIRVLSLEDFKKYSRRIGFRVLKEAAISPSTRGKGGRLVKFMPNLFATYGIYMIGKDPT